MNDDDAGGGDDATPPDPPVGGPADDGAPRVDDGGSPVDGGPATADDGASTGDDASPGDDGPAGADGAPGDGPGPESVSRAGDEPASDGGSDGSGSGGLLGLLRRFWTAEEGVLVFVRDLLSSALMVLVVAGLLFAVSGVWPPMVAVKSGSMNPHMHKGDLVFVVEEHRFAGEAAVADTGVVPHRVGEEAGYRKFGMAGDVIVYRPNNDTRRDPIIHRAMFYVEDGENWYDEADRSHVNAESCDALTFCPAPNAGFITKGDNPRTNQYYDQAQGMSRPVKPSWVAAKAMVRIPGLGFIRLEWAKLQAVATSAAGLLLVGGFAGNRALARR